MQEDLYCKIYLDGGSDVHVVKALVVEITRGSLEGRTVGAHGLLIDVFENKQVPGVVAARDDFVHWPFYLEVEASHGVKFDEYLASLASLLIELRSNGLRVVPSCDFETQLKEAMG